MTASNAVRHRTEDNRLRDRRCLGFNAYYIFNALNMGLLEEHKAERRARILTAARAAITRDGYDGLTMRELARAARVSVPTLYNLFGGKDAILTALLEAAAARLAALPPVGDSFMARGGASFELGMAMIEAEPALYRAAARVFLDFTPAHTADPAQTANATRAMRRRVEDGYVAVMAANLAAAKAAGQLADWADPHTVATHMFSIFISAFLGWALGEFDLEMFRLAGLSGTCHVLAGAARGAFADDVEAQLRALRDAPALARWKETRDANRTPASADRAPESRESRESRDD
jgi:AcrR family transcriptional regulator